MPSSLRALDVFGDVLAVPAWGVISVMGCLGSPAAWARAGA